MKGAIVNCLKEMIVSRFGQSKWNEIMVASGQRPEMIIMATSDFEDAIVVKMVENACKILNITLEEITDYFGDYWMNTYAVSVYKPYYGSNASAKDFFIRLNDIHTKVTKFVTNARPPKFEFEWKSDDLLILSYISSRGLIDFVVGLAKGVGSYFNQPLAVRKLSSTRVEIKFLS